MNSSEHRLSRELQARRYAIDLSASPETMRFEGRLVAHLEALRPFSEIELHARDLMLDGVELDHQPAGYEFRPERETVVFRPDEPVGPGLIQLSLRFSGRLNPSMHGLYLAASGSDRAVASQAEATDARAIFPCLDEPEFKAELAWTLRTPPQYVALANGPLVSVSEEGDQKVWRFAPTRPVSSYLAAVTIGEFESTEPTPGFEPPVRVFALKGRRSQAEFAHRITEALIPFYENYFGVSYPFEKYDQVAVPGFDAGAMENVGLVLFRQNLLLMNPKTTSWQQEKLIALVVAHELAHMWFGNWVTMRWWDDLWLNEAFAEWFAHKALNAIRPSYMVWSDFQRDKNRALLDDAMPTTHPIYKPVKTPAEALEMFDVITYQKGCAVMRQLEAFLGESVFQKGLQAYMKTHAESNAEGDDLWRALSEASGRPVQTLMHSWIQQPGFPKVSLRLESQASSTLVKLSQERFFSDPREAEAEAKAETDRQTWAIPLRLRYQDAEGIKSSQVLMDQAEMTLPLEVKGELAWIHGNEAELGFYRVVYEGEAADRQLAGVPMLSVPEQIGALEDAWALLKAKKLGIEAYWALASSLAKGSEHALLFSWVTEMAAMDRLLADPANEEARAALRRRLHGFLPELEKLGYAARGPESRSAEQRRVAFYRLLGFVGRHPKVIDKALELWEAEQREPGAVDPNLAGEVVRIAAQSGDVERYRSWVRTYEVRHSEGLPPQLCLRYLTSLPLFRPAPLTHKTLQAIDSGWVPQEAVGNLLSQLLHHRHSQALAWEHIQTHWAKLRSVVGDMGLAGVVEAVGSLPIREKTQIERFFKANPPRGAEQALRRALRAQDQREHMKSWLVPELVRFLLG